MRERPILFSAPMVRAILAGAKTQTRRLVKPNPHKVDGGVPFADAPAWAHAEPGSEVMRCPYGVRGDRLWVRETFSGPWCMGDAPPSKWVRSSRIWYWADGNPTEGDWTRPRPSIHMPRWASRITLEITSVRVERLKDISEADAIAEGVSVHPDHHAKPPTSHYSPYSAYRDLWEAINGAGSWDTNPWVWVVEFRRMAMNAQDLRDGGSK